MSCETVNQLLADYLADGLPSAVRAEVDSHLLSCAACRARCDEFARLDTLLQAMPREAMPPQLVTRTRDQVRRHAMRGRMGHAVPLALVTFSSLLLFVWLASDTWFALQDRVMWEFMNWMISVPDLAWQHPSEMLAGLADFAPLGRIFFTTLSAVITWRLAQYLISEFRSTSPQPG
jgi:predicted anti-sigma-YlaC factor YlaD